MTVTATSDTAGTATIENETTGKSVSKTFSGNVESSLCRTDAEWIVEDVSLFPPLRNTPYNQLRGISCRGACLVKKKKKKNDLLTLNILFPPTYIVRGGQLPGRLR